MKFNDIPVDTLGIRVKITDFSSQPLSEQPVFDVTDSPTRPGKFEIRLKDSVIFVKPVVEEDTRRLNNELAAGRPMLSRLANIAPDESIELQIKFFTGEFYGNVEIGVDDYVERRIENIEHYKHTGQSLYRYLENDCCYTHGDETFFFLIAGHAIDNELKQKDAKVPPEKPAEKQDIEASQSIPENHVPKTEETFMNSLCIIGDNIRFIATETKITEPAVKSIYITTRLTKNIHKNDRALRLAKGKLKFIDWTNAGQIDDEFKAQFSNFIKEKGSYLKKWDDIGDMEGDFMLDDARAVGVIKYNNVMYNRDEKQSVSVSITDIFPEEKKESAFEALESDDVEHVEYVEKVPDYINNQDLKFTEFVKNIEKEDEKEEKKSVKSYKVLEYNKDIKTLTLYDPESAKLGIETDIPAHGMLILSLAGDIAQIKRRMKAREKIITFRAACPHLGMIIEENGSLRPARKLSNITPVSGFVKNKVFGKYEPTDYQKKAIEIALNTPDIALIQGPPGTGKTTIIAAILERLNELADKHNKNIKGQVLLTAYQHDAVENMISRWLNGIPIPKYGKRSDSNEDGYDAFKNNLMKWRETIIKELSAKDLNIDDMTKEEEIKNLCLQYIIGPTRTLAANLAKKIASLDVSILGPDILRRAENIANRFHQEETLNNESDTLLNIVRCLRVKPESFADDGPARAAEILEELNNNIEIINIIDENELGLLDKASLWFDNGKTPPFLKDLEILKNKLLTLFTAAPVYRIEKQNNEILELAQEAINKIKENGISAKDKRSAALFEFMTELKINPDGMINAVSDYSFAFAATCQQSVNRLMQKQKGILSKNDDDNKLEYDYVIVDEAARVSPRDLMITMVQGKRIILVGDHRQLPHMIEQRIARQMDKEEGDAEKTENDWLKESMFEYLFTDRIHKLEQTDNITRHFTLKEQYRMHPLLGNFISDNFYDMSEKFISGKKPDSEDFIHNLPGTNDKHAVWLEVPAYKGNHDWEGTSMYRPAEAEAIVKKLTEWMKSNQGEPLTFGVISFYKKQADYINKLIKSKLAGIEYDEKKLLVGTVDSFQGREFDVVFLSMVRTLRENRIPDDGNKDLKIQERKVFGHLCLSNRLNVSMSRQKRLLVVAGDSGLLKHDLAKKSVPGLYNFYKLCQNEGMVLPC